MVRLELWDTVGLGLIFKLPTGIEYTNQTGGTSCLDPIVEGAYVALRNDYSKPKKIFLSPELALDKHFEGPKWGGSGATSGIDAEDADTIDGILKEAGVNASVDRSRLAESHEAWVHVVVGPDRFDPPLWSGLDLPAKAILHRARLGSS